MGNGQSMPEEKPPTMVFRGESDIPMLFSPDLINKLAMRQQEADVASSARSPAHPDELSKAEIERRVVELVAAERARLKEREKAVARREEELIDSALAASTPASPAAPTPGDGRSVSIVAQDVEELIRRNKEITVKPPNPFIAKVQQDVVECYRKKKEKPLDCWKEVDNFRASVRTAKQEFVSRNSYVAVDTMTCEPGTTAAN